MPGRTPGSHVFPAAIEDVDGRDKPGHAAFECDGLFDNVRPCN